VTTSEVAGVVVSHIVRPAHEHVFGDWTDRVSAAVRGAPGFRSIIRLDQHPAISHTLLQFESRELLDEWLKSDAFSALRAEGIGYSLRTIQSLLGSESVFTIPGSASVPRWKQAAATWLGVYPTLVVIQALFVRPLAGTVHWLVLSTGSSIVMTVMLAWVILPRVHRALRPWMSTAPGQDDGR
jgi:antibiotic biosynthesis monooxygenase (ABM) superfamily enzyme